MWDLLEGARAVLENRIIIQQEDEITSRNFLRSKILTHKCSPSKFWRAQCTSHDAVEGKCSTCDVDVIAYVFMKQQWLEIKDTLVNVSPYILPLRKLKDI